MVHYREIQPSERLRPFVSVLWMLEQDDPGAPPQRIVPDGRPELILNLGQPFESLQNGEWRPQPRCFFAGQIDSPLMLRPCGQARVLGIRFHPHGAAAIFANPMHELSGRFAPLEYLSSGLSRNINDALEAPDPVAAVEAALFSAVSRSRAVDPLLAEAVRRIGNAVGPFEIAALARDLGISPRQFERRFNAAVGLSPKVFCRIQRFSKVFHLLEAPWCDWVGTALRCGYYDQAHLIRDCKAFSGSTPTTLLAKEADLARHFYEGFAMSHPSNTNGHAFL